MPDEKKVFVSIYCKLPDDAFSREMVNQMATGKEIYDFLMKDAGFAHDENGEIIPGDCNLWYLGSNEQYGCLQFKDFIDSWEVGDSSFDRVEAFVSRIYLGGVFSDDQYRNLMAKCHEGRKIDNIHDIPPYLEAKKKGKPWIKTKEALHFRERIRRFALRVHQHLQREDLVFNDNAGRN
jgi:hypothetical protein